MEVPLSLSPPLPFQFLVISLKSLALWAWGSRQASRAMGTLLFFLLFSSFALKRKQPASGAGHGVGLKDEMSGFQGLRCRAEKQAACTSISPACNTGPAAKAWAGG